MNSHCFFVPTTGGGLLRKPMNPPLNGVAEIAQANNLNIWSRISPAIKLVGPWNLLIRVYYSQNYKIAISDKVTCWEGEQFPLSWQLRIIIVVHVVTILIPKRVVDNLLLISSSFVHYQNSMLELVGWLSSVLQCNGYCSYDTNFDLMQINMLYMIHSISVIYIVKRQRVLWMTIILFSCLHVTEQVHIWIWNININKSPRGSCSIATLFGLVWLGMKLFRSARPLQSYGMVGWGGDIGLVSAAGGRVAASWGG